MSLEFKVQVKGMHCASCAFVIENTLQDSEGVISCEVNYGNEKAKIVLDPETTNISELSKKIEPLGYSLQTQLDNTNQIHGEETQVHKGMDHTSHIGMHQSREEKLVELNEQKRKVIFVMPAAILVFVLMIWEILAHNFDWIPSFFIPKDLFQYTLLVISTVVLFWIGRTFLREVLIFAKYRVANMYTLIGIGTLTAYVYSAVVVLIPSLRQVLNLPDMVYFDVVIVVIGFVYFGKYLESRSKIITGEAIEKLLNLQSKTALVERNGDAIEISISEVELGDTIIIKPGSKIPVDGTVISGTSAVDESMITGEPIPVDKKTNDNVFAGTINKHGSFKFKATKVGKSTLLSQIIEMVDEAQGSKAPIQGLADHISSIFVPIVLIIAIITLMSWLVIGTYFLPFEEAASFAILCFVGVLVIACPCALGLATPTAIIVGTGKGAENGILIRNATALEILHKVDTVVIDKTGTITEGRPDVTDIIILNSKFNEIESLRILASIESFSEHPISSAIIKKSKDKNIDLLDAKDFKAIEGKGIEAKIDGKSYLAGNIKLIKENNIKIDEKVIDKLTEEGKTPIILASTGEVIGVFGVSDVLKDNVKQTIQELQKLGLHVILLTGDDKRAARFISSQIDIHEVIAQVLPGEKASSIKKLQEAGKVVAMVGDGINDAPALAQANVGIAMSTGTDVAIESAGIVLLGGDFSKVTKAIKLSKFTMSAIKQNLFWAFSYNIIGIPLAAGVFYPLFGIILSPVFAGLAMALSSVSVVTNSLRLKASKL